MTEWKLRGHNSLGRISWRNVTASVGGSETNTDRQNGVHFHNVLLQIHELRIGDSGVSLGRIVNEEATRDHPQNAHSSCKTDFQVENQSRAAYIGRIALVPIQQCSSHTMSELKFSVGGGGKSDNVQVTRMDTRTPIQGQTNISSLLRLINMHTKKRSPSLCHRVLGQSFVTFFIL